MKITTKIRYKILQIVQLRHKNQNFIARNVAVNTLVNTIKELIKNHQKPKLSYSSLLLLSSQLFSYIWFIRKNKGNNNKNYSKNSHPNIKTHSQKDNILPNRHNKNSLLINFKLINLNQIHKNYKIAILLGYFLTNKTSPDRTIQRITGFAL